MCLPLWQLICFPVWLVVSGSSPVSNSFVSRPCGNSLVSQSCWWCPALWLSPSHLFPLVAIHLFLTVALSLLILVVFHLSRRGEFPIVFRLPSRILIYLPELVCPLPPSVFYLSPCFFPVVFQDVVSHSSPSGLAFVFQMWSSNSLGFCSRCALPILSQLSSIPFNPHTAQLSATSRLSPQFPLPIVFQLDPLDLNLTPSLLLVCTAGFIVSTLWMFFFTCLRPPCVSHSGQWLPVSGCLSSLVSLCLSPSLALDVWWCPAVRMSFLCIHLFPIMFLLPSFSGFKYLSPNSSVFNHQSASAVVADSFACLPLRVPSIVCF